MARRLAGLGAVLALTGTVVLVGGPSSTAAPPSEVPQLIVSGPSFLRGLSDNGTRALIDTAGAAQVVDLVTSEAFTLANYGPAVLAGDGLSVLVTTLMPLDLSDTDALSDVYEWFPDTGVVELRTQTDESLWGYSAVAVSRDASVVATSAWVGPYAVSPVYDIVVFDAVGYESVGFQLATADPLAPMAMSDDGQRLLYARALPGGGHHLGVFDRGARTTVAEFTPPQPVQPVNLTPSYWIPPGDLSGDGQRVAFRDPTTNHLAVFDVMTGSRTMIAGQFDSFGDVTLSYDGRRIAYNQFDSAGRVHAALADEGRSGTHVVSAIGTERANAAVSNVYMSSDGSVAAFSTTATNLGASSGDSHTYVRTTPPRSPLPFIAVPPARLVDTRPGQESTVDGRLSGIGRREVGTLGIPVAGRGGVPANASGVIANLTITEPEAAGFATVYACGSPVPLASNLNFARGTTVAANVISALDVSGSVCVHVSAPAHVVMDVNGYTLADGGVNLFTPRRMVDTRSTGAGAFRGVRAADSVTAINLTSKFFAVPPGPFILTVTAVDPESAGFLTVFPCAASRPLASSLNFDTGRTVANTVIVQPSTPVVAGVGPVAGTPASPEICVYTSARTHLVVDVSGFVLPKGPAYSTETRGPIDTPFVAFTPARILETRDGEGSTVDGRFTGGGLLAAGTETRLTVVGRAGVPATASAVALNVTATGSTAPGFLTLWPCGSPRPTASNVNYSVGQTIANNVIAKIGGGGAVCIFNNSPTHVVVDIGGYVAE